MVGRDADTFHVGRLRPQLDELFGHDRLPGLRLVHEVRAEGRICRVFALDPPPLPSDEVGPSLGFMGDGQARARPFPFCTRSQENRAKILGAGYWGCC